jgi:hypothetical protein
MMGDWAVQGYELKHIGETLETVPAQALGIVIVCGLIGWVFAALVEPVPAGAAIFAGIVVGVLASGFNDPQLGIVHPPKPCNSLVEHCPLVLTTDPGAFTSSAPPP